MDKKFYIYYKEDEPEIHDLYYGTAEMFKKIWQVAVTPGIRSMCKVIEVPLPKPLEKPEIDINQLPMFPEDKKGLTYDEWNYVYKPTINSFVSVAPFDGMMFETIGEEISYVLSFVNNKQEKHIWTIIENEGVSYVCAGYHLINRLGYFITEVPWTDETLEIAIK